MRKTSGLEEPLNSTSAHSWGLESNHRRKLYKLIWWSKPHPSPNTIPSYLCENNIGHELPQQKNSWSSSSAMSGPKSVSQAPRQASSTVRRCQTFFHTLLASRGNLSLTRSPSSHLSDQKSVCRASPMCDRVAASKIAVFRCILDVLPRVDSLI